MPDSGPVVETTSTARDRDDSSGSASAHGARGKGDSADEIVKGFLDAMTATPDPDRTSARAVPHQAGRAVVAARAGMVIYATPRLRGGSNVEVALTLIDADRPDARGAWLGRCRRPTRHFPMAPRTASGASPGAPKR